MSQSWKEYKTLLSAVANNDCNVLGDLLKKGYDVNLNLDEYIGTPLHYSIELGHHDAFMLLLSHNADVEALLQYNHQTPLMRACQYGNRSMVKALLEAGVSIDRQTERCSSALILACHFGFQDLVEFLLDKGADPTLHNSWGFTALYMATDNWRILQRLLKESVDVNEKCGEREETPLHLAAVVGSYESASLLLSAGADADALTLYDETPLWLAAWKGHIDVLKLLVEYNCDLDRASNGCQVYRFEYTPLELALGANDMEMATVLVKSGCKTVNAAYTGDASWEPDAKFPWILLRKEILDFIQADPHLHEECVQLLCNPTSLQNMCLLCLRSSFRDFRWLNYMLIPRKLQWLIRKVYLSH